jgi:tetratricopeptide (TPR) repeat protein
LNNLGQTFYQLGNYNDALDIFNNALQLDPNNVNILNNLGQTFDQLGNYNDALDIFNNALQLDPNNVRLLEITNVLNNNLMRESF